MRWFFNIFSWSNATKKECGFRATTTTTAGGIKFDRGILTAFEARTCFCGPALSPSKMPLTWPRSYKETRASEDDMKEWKLCCAYDIE